MSARSVIVAGARTPIGRFGGAFRDLAAVDLGGAAIRAALERAALAGADVDYVGMGQGLQAGGGPNTPPPAPHKGGGPPPGAAPPHQKDCPPPPPPHPPPGH